MRFPIRSLAALSFLLPVAAGATMTTGRMELQARIAVQNSFHHDSVETIDWVQERNELRFDLKYDLIERGEELLGVRRARFNMLYRGRYDGIFDIRDDYGEHGYRRDDFRFPEGKIPREAFLDLEFGGFLSPVSARIGRQQVVWGEADLFRSIDVVNPLRLDQNGLLGDDFADYREPLWIGKFLWDVGQLGPFAGTGFELFYSANSRPVTDRIIIGEAFRIGVDQNNPVDGFRRRNGLPFQQVRHPWEIQRIGPYKTEAQDFADLGALGMSDFVYLTNNDFPTSTFDFAGSMAGIRMLTRVFGVDMTFNYIFKRTELAGTALIGRDLFDPDIATDGSPNARLDLLAQAAAAAATPGGNEDLIRRCVHEHEPLFVFDDIHGSGNPQTGCITVPFWYPWTHVVGFTANYNDYQYTGLVFRLEQSYSTKEPRNGVPPLAGPRAGEFPTQRDFDTNGRRETDVWRGMVGFDYLRALNVRAARLWPQPFRSLLGSDQWLFSGQIFNEYYAHADGHIGLLDSITDRQHHWNPMVTFLATGFFLQQRFRPILAAGYDVNDQFPVFWLQGEYNIGTRWSLRIGEVLYAGSKHAEQFLYLNKYADRDTFFVRLTYFLI